MSIEELIKNNIDKLSNEEPSNGHQERFLSKLDGEFAFKPAIRFRKRIFIYSVAASFVVLITAGMFLFSHFYSPASQQNASMQVENKDDLSQLEFFYASMNEEKLNTIDKLAADDKHAAKIKEDALKEMQNINTTTQELQYEYQKSGKNPRVLDAIVNNYRIVTKLLDHIITELQNEPDNTTTLIRKPQSHEKRYV